MNLFISYLKNWYSSKTNVPLGILLISLYFILNVVYGSLKNLDPTEILVNQSVLSLIIFYGMFVTGVGLILKEGWAWTFSIAIIIYYLGHGLLVALANFLYYKYIGNYEILIVSILLTLLINLPIIYYLFRKKIRNLFPKSPISLFIIGLYLMSFGWFNQIDSLPFFIEGTLMAVGMAIILKSGKHIRDEE